MARIFLKFFFIFFSFLFRVDPYMAVCSSRSRIFCFSFSFRPLPAVSTKPLLQNTPAYLHEFAASTVYACFASESASPNLCKFFLLQSAHCILHRPIPDKNISIFDNKKDRGNKPQSVFTVTKNLYFPVTFPKVPVGNDEMSCAGLLTYEFSFRISFPEIFPSGWHEPQCKILQLQWRVRAGLSPASLLASLTEEHSTYIIIQFFLYFLSYHGKYIKSIQFFDIACVPALPAFRFSCNI